MAQSTTYSQIVVACQGARPTTTSKQVWRKMIRVAGDPKLATVDPGRLPTSLSALLELVKAPPAVFDSLQGLGMLGPNLSARRIREFKAGRIALEVVVNADKVEGILRVVRSMEGVRQAVIQS